VFVILLWHCRYFEASGEFIYERGFFEMYLVQLERAAYSSHSFEDNAIMNANVDAHAVVISRFTLYRAMKSWMVVRDFSRFEYDFKLRDFRRDAVISLMEPLLGPVQEWIETSARNSHREHCPFGQGGTLCCHVLDGNAKVVCNMCPFHASIGVWNPEGLAGAILNLLCHDYLFFYAC
jgi:hypothetical protein